MRLDLREIIGVPGASVPFECALDGERLDFPFVVTFTKTPEAKGEVRNSAGAMTLTGELSAAMTVRCDRCAREYGLEKKLSVKVPLAAELQDEDSSDVFLLDGDFLDLDEVLKTCFILEMDAKHLCRPDCAGLCESCGADLNSGPCACRAKTDPRLAVLEQLLDIDD